MAIRTSTSGVTLGFVALGLAFGCAGASFESGGAGAGGEGASGGTSGTSGKGGTTSKGGSSSKGGTTSKGGSGGSTAATGGTSGTSGTTARGGGGGKGGTSGTSGTAGDAGMSGTTAVGGTTGSGGTANGGTSGTAGSFPCVTGGECADDGDQCSEGKCCSCSHTCNGGVWGPALCPPCLAPICPDQPAADGDACDECSLPSDGCTWDQCPDAPLTVGSCVDGHWQTTVDDSCTLGGNCCTGNGDCADHHCIEGVCKDDDARGCWDDDQCLDDTECSGVWVCPCNADCGGFDEPGTCVPKDADCCKDDGDCNGSGSCRSGVCKTPDPLNGCWSDRDCLGGTCEGETICACGSDCIIADNPGQCVYPL